MAVERELRIQSDRQGGTALFVVPAKPDWLVIFGAVFIVLHNFVIFPAFAGRHELDVLSLLFSQSIIFMAVFLVLSATVLIILVGSLLWSAFGSERVHITKDRVDHEVRILGFTHARAFWVSHISSVQWLRVSRLDRSLKARLGSHIVMLFSGGQKTGLAFGTNRQEAQVILEAMTQVAGIPQK